MEPYLNFGLYLKQKRNEAGYTQAELAGTLGDMEPQFVSNWERGKCAPPSHCLPQLISVLKLNREKMVEYMVQDSKALIEKKIYQAKRTRRKKS